MSDSDLRQQWAVYKSGAQYMDGYEATVGTPQQPSPEFKLRGKYFSGGTEYSTNTLLKTVVGVTNTPSLYVYFGDEGSEALSFIGSSSGLDLQAHSITQVGGITMFAGGNIDLQSGDLLSVDDITFSGSSSVADFQGGTISGVSSITLSSDGYLNSIGNDIYINPAANVHVDGYIIPTLDNTYNLGRQAQRWKELWLGPSSLHIRQDANENDIGVERDWNIGINSAGTLRIRQAADVLMTVTSSGDVALSNTNGPMLENSASTATNPTLIPNRASLTAGIGGTGGDVSIITGGTERINVDTAGNITFNPAASINGIWTHNSSMNVIDNFGIAVGTSFDAGFGYRTVNTPDTMVLNVSADSNGLVIIEGADVGVDFAHPLQTNPTVFIQSADATNINQWLSLAHNQTDGYIEAGFGGIALAPHTRSPMSALTLGSGATSFTITSNVMAVTADAGTNTIATIIGGKSGLFLTIICRNAGLIITDNDTGTADTINISAAFTGTANDTITLVSDGTSWYETSRAVN